MSRCPVALVRCAKAVAAATPRPGSLEIDDVRARVLAFGRRAPLARRTQVDEAQHVLLGREADCGTALWGAQDGWRAPVAGQASGVSGEQHDVCGDRAGVEVLLVLKRLAGEHGTGHDERWRAVELCRMLL